MHKAVATLLALITVATLAACGGSSNKSATSTSSSSPSSSSSSTSSSSAAATSGDFCKDLGNSAENVNDDPNSAKQALAVLRAVNPPDEIKGDWNDYLKAVEEISQADQNNQAALATIGARHAKSLAAVSLYISKSCASFGGSELSSLSDSLSSLSDSLSSSGN